MREMRLLAIDDLVMEDLRLPELPLIVDTSERNGYGVRSRQGISGEVFMGGEAQPATWRIAIPHNDIASRDAILAALTGDQRRQRRLLAKRVDIEETQVIIAAAVVQIRERNSRHLEVEMRSESSVWQSQAASRSTKTLNSVIDRVMHLDVPGNTQTVPQVTITPVTQRAAGNSIAGWRYRKRATIVNLTTEPFFRFPVRIDIGDTAALVSAGKTLVSGNDLRVWQDGSERERTLIGMNTAATKVWVILDVRPDEAATIDLVYGNPGAIAPPVLTYPNRPAFDLSVSSNNFWSWPVDAILANYGLGLWYLADPKKITTDFSIPGAWHLLATEPVPDNTDIHRANETTAYTVGVETGFRATMDIYRASQHYDEPTLPIVPNPYDSIGLSHPFSITNLSFTWLWQNINGRAIFVALQRDSSAEEWGEFFNTGTTSATLAAMAPFSWNFVAAPKQVAMGIHPANRVEIVKASYRTDFARVMLDDALSITVADTAGMSITVGPEEHVYELATELRLGGGPQLVAPYDALIVGNGLAEFGATTRRCALRFDQQLLLNGETRQAQIWNATSDAAWRPPDAGVPLLAWLKADYLTLLADGAVMSTFTDASGNGNNAVNATTGEKPTYQTNEQNGLPIVRFDGGNDDMTLSGIDLPADASIFVLFKSTADTTIGQRVYSSTSNNHILLLHSPDANDARMQQIAGTLDYADEAIGVNTWQLHSNIYNGTTSRGALNGLNVAGSVGTAGGVAVNLVIGSSGAGAWIGMDLAEMVVYDGAISLNDQARVEGYLASKWGLQSILTAGHTYKIIAPGVMRPSALAERIPARSVVALEGWDSAGVAGEGPSAAWLPLSLTRTHVPNGTFDTSVSGWEVGEMSTGSTMTLLHDLSQGGDALGSLAATVTTTGGVNRLNEILCSTRFPVNGRTSVQVAGWRLTNNTNLVPRLRVRFYNEADALLVTLTEALWTPDDDVGSRGIYVARVPDRATYFRVGLVSQSLVAGGPHTMWWDDITVNDADLMVTDVNIGEITVDVDIAGRWL